MRVPPTEFAESASGLVAYQVVGDGPVTLLVCKPILFPIDLIWEEPAFTRFLAGLSSFSRSIWVDPLGTGASDAVDEVEGRLYESHIASMLAALDAVGCERASVLGLAPPALQFAATYPDRTDALVLFNTAARFRWSEDYPEGMSNEEIERILRRVAGPTNPINPQAVPAPSLQGNESFERWYRRCVRLSAPPAHRFWRVRSTFNIDFRAVLPAIRVPTLAIQRGGTPSTRAQRKYVADHVEGARTVTLPGEDELFFAGDPGPLLDTIEEFVTGDRPFREADRALATIMFTDLVDSTPHAARAGDRRWLDLLVAHDEVVRRHIDRFQGREIKTTGDGFLATFDGPGRALRCAAAIRDAVASLGIDLRIGLHTGEIELRGDDIGGIAVHIAKRVEASARPGEILVSRTVSDLVAGSGLEFVARGTHTLKGVPGNWQLFALQ